MGTTNDVINGFFGIVEQYINSLNALERKVVDYKTPSELKKMINFTISSQGEDYQNIFQYINSYLDYSVATGNKQFFNQFYSGFNLPAFMGEVLTAISNTSMYTYEVAPVATLIEMEMIKKMSEIVGFNNGDGIFVTGGSNANLIAMFSARNKLFPEIMSIGMKHLPQMSLFVSDQAHYSFENAANLLGLGTSSIYSVKSDINGSMLVSDLEEKILESRQKNEVPFFVVATAGTTMLSSFDPIEAVIETAHRHNIWCHVDGAFGGSLILSHKTRHLFNGVEKADSFAWDPHKIMNIPLMSSVILTREKGRLAKNITNLQDDYIYHDTETGNYDLGKKSIQCGRRVDALKLWLSWKYYGDQGYGQRITRLLELSEYFENKIKENSRFQLTKPRQTLNVCFRYMPLKDINIDDFNKNIRETLRKTGKTLVNFGIIDNRFTFRWVVSNPEVTEKDIDIFFDNFLTTADQLEDNMQTIN